MLSRSNECVIGVTTFFQCVSLITLNALKNIYRHKSLIIWKNENEEGAKKREEEK